YSVKGATMCIYSGVRPLRVAQEVRVDAQLEDRARLALARELGVDDFVGPGAEAARRFDPPKHVGAASKAAMGEGPLDNDRHAAAEGIEGLCDGGSRDFGAVDVDDVEAAGSQMVDECFFV